jgi:ornithine cyclodeaminase/alanine dehydrogenase-like protein (mu-crystallin family)
MPSYLKESSSLGIKIVSVRQNNSDKNLPTVPGVILLFDEISGFFFNYFY